MSKPRYRVAARFDGTVEKVTPVASKFTANAGGYEGAGSKRRLYGFRPSEGSINSLLLGAGPVLRARARHLVRNNPYARRAQRVFVSNVVGAGIRPIPETVDADLKRAISALWNDWVDECDADGLMDFYGLQTLAARAIFDAGECFVRFRPRYARDGLSVPLQLQVLESEFCPYELNQTLSNGNVIRSGVEFNPIGKRVAYHFWRKHPGEYAMTPGDVGLTRVPAEDVMHIFEPMRPGQVRGVSWLAAAIVRAWLTDQYEDAELERKKVAALFAGFITRPAVTADDPPLGAQEQPGEGGPDTSQNADNEVIAGLSPGMMQVLEEGEDIKFSAPADVGPNFEAFLYRALLAMCAGMDMPYSNVTGDFKSANYSSERARMLDTRAAVKPVQKALNFTLNKPTYRRMISDAVVAGALDVTPARFMQDRRDIVRAGWIPPLLEWVNPKDDADATIALIRAGLKSRESAVLEREGKTLDQLDEEIARGNASADSHGHVFDTDPRNTQKPARISEPNSKGPAAVPPEDAIVDDEAA